MRRKEREQTRRREFCRITLTPLKAASKTTIIECCNADDIGGDEESEGAPPKDSL